MELGLNLNSFADLKGTSKSSAQNFSSPGKANGSKGEDVQSFQSQMKSSYEKSRSDKKERPEFSDTPRKNEELGSKQKTKESPKENLQAQSNAQNPEVNSKNYESQSFNEKPIGPAGPGYGPPSISSSPASVERVLPDPVSSAQVSEKVNAASVNNLTRRVAWQRFLQQMKSELDVSAEEILVAFGSLTPEELELPPEQNINKLVDQLGLNPQQSQMATQLFTDLMDKTGSRPLAQELKASGRDINLSLMSQREQDQRRITMALDRMNQQFFMKSPQAAPGATPPQAMMSQEANPLNLTEDELQVLQAISNKQPLNEVTLQSGKQVSPELLQRMTAVNEAEGKEILARLAQAKGQQVPNEDLASESQEGSSEEDPMAAFFQEAEVGQPTQVNAAAQGPTKAAVKPSSEDTLAQIFQKSLGSLSASGAAVTTKPEVGADGDSGGSQQEAFNGEAALASTGAVGASLAAKKSGEFDGTLQGLMAGTEKGGSSPETLTSEALLQKTQVMIRDGGGEVKVILEPEGLGEVAMKVSVQGDKVNIEMITESDVAKKILEKGMGDLKSHLLASQLDLQSIKVDTASNMGQQLEQQYEDARRQQAYNFMQEFRQDNQQFRQGFTDLPGARNYRSQTKVSGPAVEEASPPKGEQARRLNLVA